MSAMRWMELSFARTSELMPFEKANPPPVKDSGFM
jgi:hypothetical protein